jgi:hypothetical protein
VEFVAKNQAPAKPTLQTPKDPEFEIHDKRGKEMKVTNWLLESDEPWTRYRTLLDLLDRPEDDPEVQAARAEMLAHPQVQEMIAESGTTTPNTPSTSSARWPTLACGPMIPDLP